MTLEEIIEMPEVVNKVHQSCYKSTQILRYVIEMLERGDSPATILDVIRLVDNYPKKENQ